MGTTLSGTISNIPADVTINTHNPAFANYEEKLGISPLDCYCISVPDAKSVLHIYNSFSVVRKKVRVEKIAVPGFYIYIVGNKNCFGHLLLFFERLWADAIEMMRAPMTNEAERMTGPLAGYYSVKRILSPTMALYEAGQLLITILMWLPCMWSWHPKTRQLEYWHRCASVVPSNRVVRAASEMPNTTTRGVLFRPRESDWLATGF